MMTEEAAATFDDPLLVALAQSLKEHLGDYKGLDRKRFEIVAKVSDSSVPTRITCVLQFSRGSANAKMQILDGKITTFFVQSKQLPKGWVVLPADTTLWRMRGRQFIISYFDGDIEKCYRAMNVTFQKKVPLQHFQQDARAAIENLGKPLSVGFIREEQRDQLGKIVQFIYQVKWEKTSVDTFVRFEFIGLKGSPIGFGRAVRNGAVTGG